MEEREKEGMRMMLPGMRETEKQTATVTAFSGIDRRNEREIGALAACRNLVPGDGALTLRDRRQTHTTLTQPEGLLVTDRVICADGTKITVNGIQAATVTTGAKQLIPFGQQVMVLPDKVLVDTVNATSRAVEHTFTAVGNVTYTLCLLDGTPVTLASGMAAEAAEGTCALSGGQVMMVTGGVWSAVAGTLVKITATGVGSGFATGDGVTLTGSSAVENCSYVLESASANEIVIAAVLNSAAVTNRDSLTVSRTMPALEFACEMDNRLWGVAGDTVYASRLGDAANWHVYEGLSTDAYAVAIAAPGRFTGLIRQGNSLVIFREDCFFRLTGTTPATFRLRRCDLPGIPRGSEKSLTSAMEQLFFMTDTGFALYDGAEETVVSRPLGIRDCANPVAWTEEDSVCLYGVMGGAPHLYRLHLPTMVWTEEDTAQGVLAGCRGYRLLANGTVTKPGGSESLSWLMETAPVKSRTLHQARLCALGVGLTLPQGSSAMAEVRYDEGNWRTLRTMTGGTERTEKIHLIPRRCRSFALRLSGTGDVTVQRLTVRTGKGSDRV